MHLGKATAWRNEIEPLPEIHIPVRALFNFLGRSRDRPVAVLLAVAVRGVHLSCSGAFRSPRNADSCVKHQTAQQVVPRYSRSGAEAQARQSQLNDVRSAASETIQRSRIPLWGCSSVQTRDAINTAAFHEAEVAEANRIPLAEITCTG